MRPSTGFPALLAFGCAVLVFFETRGHYLARLINGWFPCRQDPANSAPCHVTTSLAVIVVAAAVGLAALAVILVRVLMARRP
ncbi:hypothetical protein J8I29_01045 [Labrys sp. LIt4]|uniref:hypothetical protein n=1 Tax=Labrys sp. LIt4 TaxID=2821355 RepID=UPI001AE07372|nr:hypothetical protein [Labrys sp. LIt4]MBP0577884.1 hypothetical protein [Labrys sp. LIt4]